MPEPKFQKQKPDSIRRGGERSEARLILNQSKIPLRSDKLIGRFSPATENRDCDCD